MKIIIYNTAFILAISTTACSSGSTTGSDAGVEISQNDARTKAASLVSGEVQAVTETTEDNVRLWNVSVKVANGAVIDVMLERASGKLFEIEDKKGPFDYTISAPDTGLLNYLDAKTKAFAVKSGNLVAWNIAWQGTALRYEFYVRTLDSQLFEIQLKGDTGDTISVEEKNAVD